MIINSINALMAHRYKKNIKSETQNFNGNTLEKTKTTNHKFVSDKNEFAFLKDLFK